MDKNKKIGTSKRIRIIDRETIRYTAFCNVCSFSLGFFQSIIHEGSSDVRKLAREHVLETGHTVTIEAINKFKYERTEQGGKK